MLGYQVHGPLSHTGNACIAAPISKSDLHRLILAASLCQEQTLVQRCTLSEDIRATARVLETLGGQIKFGEDCIHILPNPQISAQPVLCDCSESGSTLRFLVPVFAALGQPATFIGHGRLAQRPMEPLLSELSAHGVQLSLPENGDTLPLVLSGKLHGGDFSFSGDISSQYITGLLFALPLLQQDSRILMTSPLQSKGYVDMTLSVLSRFGIRIDLIEGGWHIPGRQHYRSPGKLLAQGDWSNAAFWIVAGAIAPSDSSPYTLRVTGVDPQALQGDKAVCAILRQMGAHIVEEKDAVQVTSGDLHAVTIDAAQIPDIIPILSVAAAVAKGETHLVHAGRLRIKESDRLHAIYDCLQALGADVQELDDGLIIHGKPQLSGGTVDSFNDHRIAMSMAVASLRCDQPVLIRDPLCVNKSYPDFYQDFIKTGGKVDVIDLGD